MYTLAHRLHQYATTFFSAVTSGFAKSVNTWGCQCVQKMKSLDKSFSTPPIPLSPTLLLAPHSPPLPHFNLDSPHLKMFPLLSHPLDNAVPFHHRYPRTPFT